MPVLSDVVETIVAEEARRAMAAVPVPKAPEGRPELSLHEQLAVAENQALASLHRMNAALRDMEVAKLTGIGRKTALALYRSAHAARLAAIERITELRGQCHRVEREAGLLVRATNLPRTASPELRTP